MGKIIDQSSEQKVSSDDYSPCFIVLGLFFVGMLLLWMVGPFVMKVASEKYGTLKAQSPPSAYYNR